MFLTWDNSSKLKKCMKRIIVYDSKSWCKTRIFVCHYFLVLFSVVFKNLKMLIVIYCYPIRYNYRSVVI